MSAKIKTPEREKIPTLCDEWLEYAEPALRTLEIAHEPDTCGYNRPPYPRFLEITRRLVAWCQSEADEIDPGPLDELAVELVDPWHVRLPSADIRRLWETSEKILVRIRQQIITGAKPSASPCRYAPGFRSVHWHGVDYSFTQNQAACIKELWTAWENGTPELDGLTVVTAADVAQARLVDVFKAKGGMHSAWGSLVVSGTTKGAYRLADGPIAEKGRKKVSRKTPRKTPR
ncbi:MAG: hypothetical protein K8R46_10940 [Pirellulales bacterium]|nr:hypothetical protein [Pirellulales bacterium]